MGAMIKAWRWCRRWEELGTRRMSMSSPQGEAESGIEIFYWRMPMPLHLRPRHGAQGPEPEPASISTEGEEHRGNIPVQNCG